MAEVAFLEQLVRGLGRGWIARYETIEPYGVIGVTLTSDVPGKVEVVPSSVKDNVVSWSPFSLGRGGTPHYDLHTDGELIRTCVLDDAIALLQAWRRAKTPLVPSAPRAMLDAMRPHLAAIGMAEPVVLSIEVDPAAAKLTAPGKTALDAALGALDPAAVALYAPRDDDGRLQLATEILLAPLASTARLAAGREIWLALAGPRSRKQGATLVARLVDTKPVHASHRWDVAPWQWKVGAKLPPLDRRAIESIAQLDAGRFEAAFASYGIAFEPKVQQVLGGIPVGTHDAKLAGSWQTALRRALWESAPWLIAIAPRGGRLVLLPNQRHLRKAWIVRTPAGLGLAWSGNNERLPHAAWKRPLAIDLRRLGLATPVPPAAITRRAPLAAPEQSLAEALEGRALGKIDRARRLAKQREPGAAAAELLAIAEATKGDARANALSVLGGIAEPAHGPAFASFLGDPARAVKLAAIAGVKAAGYAAAVPALAALVIEARDRVALPAARAMKALSGQRGAAALTTYLGASDPRVREAACLAYTIFANAGGKAARPHLEQLLDDDDPRVAKAARRALGAI